MQWYTCCKRSMNDNMMLDLSGQTPTSVSCTFQTCARVTRASDRTYTCAIIPTCDEVLYGMHRSCV